MTAAAGPWWHAYGRELRGALGEGVLWQLTVVSPSTAPPDVAATLDAGTWGDYLTSWDHEPTDDEKDAVTPAPYRSTGDEDDPAADTEGTPAP